MMCAYFVRGSVFAYFASIKSSVYVLLNWYLLPSPRCSLSVCAELIPHRLQEPLAMSKYKSPSGSSGNSGSLSAADSGCDFSVVATVT